MEKRLVDKNSIDVPSVIKNYLEKGMLYDSSCNSGAKTYFIDSKVGYYLKMAPKGTLEKENILSNYFYKKGMGAKVVEYCSLEEDFLLTERVKGEDCTSQKYLSNPTKLCDRLGEELRKLHENNFEDFPFKNKMDDYFSLAENNYRTENYDKSHFPDSYGYSSGEEAYKVFQEGKGILKKEVLLHGDYCLPNVILDDWKLSAFIDVGGAGIGDRHIDIFWGLWSLGFNLKTEKYNTRFLDAYGRDLIDKEKLKVIASIEVFG